MKHLLPSLALLVAAALLFACQSAPKFSANQLPVLQIRWGSGGGFTGKETSFALLENGQIFQFKTLDGSAAERPSIKSKAARKLFSSSKKLGLRDVIFDQPGNMYYFLELRDEAGTHRIVWSDATPAEPKVRDFYQSLQDLAVGQK